MRDNNEIYLGNACCSSILFRNKNELYISPLKHSIHSFDHVGLISMETLQGERSIEEIIEIARNMGARVIVPISYPDSNVDYNAYTCFSINNNSAFYDITLRAKPFVLGKELLVD